MATKELIVGVHNYKPVVYCENDKWKGLEVELWERVAAELDLSYSYENVDDFSDLLGRTQQGDIDVAIAGITRTTDRIKKLKMSFYTLDTGLGIAVLPRNLFSLKDLFKSLFSRQTVLLLFVLVLYAVITAHIYWFIEAGESVSVLYSQGLLESFWWSVVTFSTVGYGDIYPATVFGKAFGVLAILSGLAIFGLYIGQLSASLALVKLKSKISSEEDLAGMKVGVKANTTAGVAAKAKKAKVLEYIDLNEAYEALSAGRVDAVVADMPVLQDQSKEHGFLIPSPAFSRQAYVFAFPKTSSNNNLIQKINTTMIQLRESGVYDEIYSKYLPE